MQNPVRRRNATTPPSASSPEQRLKLRDAFFKRVKVSAILHAFDDIPGLLYIVKDRDSRVMAISPGSVKRMGYQREEEVIGRPLQEYLPQELADKFRADDLWVLSHGEARRDMVEIWFDSEGKRDWIVTSKYPLRDTRGSIIGVIGILQNLEVRQKRLAELGPVGKAVDCIRARLGEVLMVSEIARCAGLSERQLQRLFRRVLGQSIQQYIIRTRVHAAAHELTHSERNITEIALMFGFNDQSALSNTFRTVTGFSPRAYRQRST